MQASQPINSTLRMNDTALSSATRDARRHALLFAGSLVATFAGLRIWLNITPNADFNVLGYNIHHLFTGVLIATGAAIPLAIGIAPGRARDTVVAALGVGFALILDEWVYLITTPGTNADYLLPISFRGGVVMIAIAVVFTAVCYRLLARR
jgi:hypothetical protein